MGGEDWEGMLELLRIVAFTPTANMTGQPAIALPTGLDGEGLPVSVQLVGRPADEDHDPQRRRAARRDHPAAATRAGELTQLPLSAPTAPGRSGHGSLRRRVPAPQAFAS